MDPTKQQQAADAAQAALHAAHTPSRFQTIVASAKARIAEFAAEALGSADVQRFVADLELVAMGAVNGLAEKACPPLELVMPVISKVEASAMSAGEAELVKLAAVAKAKADELAKEVNVSTDASAADPVASFLAGLGEEGLAKLRLALK